MVRWRLKSPASWLFTQPFIQAQIKENIKAPRHWPLYGEFIGDRWIPRTKRPVTRKMFPFDDVIMWSFCVEKLPAGWNRRTAAVISLIAVLVVVYWNSLLKKDQQLIVNLPVLHRHLHWSRSSFVTTDALAHWGYSPSAGAALSEKLNMIFWHFL